MVPYNFSYIKMAEKPAIIFAGEHDGRMNVVAVVFNKRLDLFAQTMYVNVKKGNLATPMDEQASINTPEASSGTVSSKPGIDEDGVNSNIKFSLWQPVEETKMLIAMHNVEGVKFSERDPAAEKLNRALQKENAAQKEEIPTKSNEPG